MSPGKRPFLVGYSQPAQASFLAGLGPPTQGISHACPKEGGCAALSCQAGTLQQDPYSALGFRFKVFADYEAYIKCQGQVDQLFMVRGAHYGEGGMGSLAMAVQWGELG